jgi:ADP-heptose:LPS heptosyltransferase
MPVISPSLREQAAIGLNGMWRTLRTFRMSLLLLCAAGFRLFHRRKAGKERQADESKMAIVVVRLDALGDVLLSTPIFHALRTRYPEAHITAIVQERCAILLKSNPYLDRVISPFKARKGGLFSGIRQELSILQFYWHNLLEDYVDVVLQPRFGFDYFGENLLVCLLDAPLTIRQGDGFARGPAKIVHRLAFRRAKNLKIAGPLHEVIRNAKVVESLTGQLCAWPPELFLNDGDGCPVNELRKGKTDERICVAIGFGAQARKRVWSLESWSEVVNELARQSKIEVVIICAESESPAGRVLQSRLIVDSMLLVEKPLLEVAAVLESCDLFLGADSGLAHVAAAVGCSTVIVSPHPLDGDPDHENSPIRFRPYTDNGVVIQPLTALRPCKSGCQALEAHCILQISAEEVAQAGVSAMFACRRDKLGLEI